MSLRLPGFNTTEAPTMTKTEKVIARAKFLTRLTPALTREFREIWAEQDKREAERRAARRRAA
jgi:hypothetical protein